MNRFEMMPIAETLGWCLFHSIWQIALLALSVKLLLAIISQRYSTTRYTLALVGLSMMVALPVVTWFNITIVEPMPAVSINPELATVTAAYFSNAVLPVETVSAIEDSDWLMSIQNVVRPWLPVATLAWLVGLLVFSVRPAFGVLTVLRMKRRGTSVVPIAVEGRFHELMKAMQISRPIQIMQSSLTKVPMVVGFLKPMVLVPASSLTSLSAHELEAILAHELAHLRRYDDVVNFFQTVIESAFFYHPCAWWMSAVVRTERENCCDDIAVGVVGSPKPLATALLQLEQIRVAQPALSASGGSLVKRIRRLSPATKTVRHSSPWLYIAMVGFVMTISCWVGLVAEKKADAAAAPSFISTQEDLDETKTQKEKTNEALDS